MGSRLDEPADTAKTLVETARPLRDDIAAALESGDISLAGAAGLPRLTPSSLDARIWGGVGSEQVPNTEEARRA